ncbi:MAG: hypothetical protein ACJARS_003944 [bacterium]|jgi:hypothetical protein
MRHTPGDPTPAHNAPDNRICDVSLCICADQVPRRAHWAVECADRLNDRWGLRQGPQNGQGLVYGFDASHTQHESKLIGASYQRSKVGCVVIRQHKLF